MTNNLRKRIQQPLKPHPTVEREGWRQGKKASVKPHYHQKSSLPALTSPLISISQGTQYLSSLEKHPIFAETGCPHSQHWLMELGNKSRAHTCPGRQCWCVNLQALISLGSSFYHYYYYWSTLSFFSFSFKIL